MNANRRELLKSAFRVAALGALSGGAAALIGRPKKIEKCIADGICTSCRSLADCGLPQALSVKQSRKSR